MTNIIQAATQYQTDVRAFIGTSIGSEFLALKDVIKIAFIQFVRNGGTRDKFCPVTQGTAFNKIFEKRWVKFEKKYGPKESEKRPLNEMGKQAHETAQRAMTTLLQIYPDVKKGQTYSKMGESKVSLNILLFDYYQKGGSHYNLIGTLIGDGITEPKVLGKADSYDSREVRETKEKKLREAASE